MSPSRDTSGTGVWAFANPWRPADLELVRANVEHGRTALEYGVLWTLFDADLENLQPLRVSPLPSRGQWREFAKEPYTWRVRGGE